MAIASENERRSVHAYTPGAAILPVADNNIVEPDRRAIAWIYAATLSGVSGAIAFSVDTAPKLNFGVDAQPKIHMDVDAQPSIGMDSDS